MNCIKKITTLILALAFFVPCGVISACERNAEPPTTNGPEEPAPEEPTPEEPTPEEPTPEEPTPEEETPATGVDPTDPTKLKAPTLTMKGNVAHWKSNTLATKYVYKIGESGTEKETNELQVYLTNGQTLYVKAIGNDYKDSDWAQITYVYEDPYIAPPTWNQPTDLDTFTSGTGEEYDRFEGTVGYYSISITAGQTNYYSFSVPNAGQYALVTNQAKTGLTIERCDASSAYISPNTHPALVLENNTLYSYVHCATSHFNAEWRATYKISCTADTTLVIRFVRVADALREPARIVTPITAQEIVGKAQNAPTTHLKKEIPWTTADNPSYFYDENYQMTFTDLETGETKTKKGFYRYGQAGDDNAPVIWVAITSAPSRYLGKAFSQIQYDGNNLTLHVDTAENGDLYFNSYVDFIMNNGGEVDNENGGTPIAGDNKMLCYMNVTNADGLYPVNQELFNFLNLYTSLNPPILGDGVSVDSKDYWLAPCYYYEEQALGTKENPITLNDGENAVSISESTSTFYKINATVAKTYTLTGSAGLVYFDGKNHHGKDDGNGFTVTVDVPAGGLIIELKTRTTGDYTLTLTVVTQ
jgi:hypothetical protein